MPRQTPVNVEYLREYGPTPVSRLPGGKANPSDRAAGLRLLKLYGLRGVQHSEHIAYLDDHDPTNVVRVWADANPTVLEAKTYHGLMVAFGGVNDEFQQAARIVLGQHPEFEGRSLSNNKGSRYTGGAERKVPVPTLEDAPEWEEYDDG